MNKLSIDKVELKNKRVLVRVDFNIPLDEKLNVTNDIRIVESLPTIKKIIGSRGKAILMSHLGRPKGEHKPEFSLKPAAERLSNLIGKEVKLAPDCIGSETEKLVNEMKPGDISFLKTFASINRKRRMIRILRSSLQILEMFMSMMHLEVHTEHMHQQMELQSISKPVLLVT